MPDQNIPLAHVVGQMIRPQPGCQLLFVYDQLMDPKVLGEIAPDPVFVTKARLGSRQFIVNRSGRCSVVPRVNHTVHGLIYSLENVSLTCLSIQLGFPGTYERYGAFARNPAGTLAVVEFFGLRDQRFGKGSPDTIGSIVALAQHHGFPPDYIDEIREWDANYVV